MQSFRMELPIQGAVVTESNRRRERRYSIPNPPIVSLKIPPESGIIEAELVNVSKNGVGLISMDYITPGLQIMFRFGHQHVFARVRYCKAVDNGFSIGAVIRDVVDNHGESGASLEL